MCPGNLARKVAILDKFPHVGFVFSDAAVINQQSQVIRNTWFVPSYQEGVISGDEMFRSLFSDWNRICAPTVLMRRSLLERVGLFNEHLGFALDYEMWMRMSLHSDAYCVADALVQYRWHANNESKQYVDSIDELQEMVKAKLMSLDALQSTCPTDRRDLIAAAIEWYTNKLNDRIGRKQQQDRSPTRIMVRSAIRRILKTTRSFLSSASDGA